jgi:hypothetical protein
VTAAAAGPISCDSGATASLHGLDVSPSLTPAVAALWKHPLFGGGGIYIGTGGLSLFQFDLDGSITVNLGVSVSGSSTCTLHLPTYTSTVPAGGLGAIILQLQPSLTLHVTGKIDVRTSVTLRCGAEYRWDAGQEYRVSYCAQGSQPLQLSADSGVSATLTGALDASVTLDDLVGITGNLTATLHAAYSPAAHPIAEVDAQMTYDLGACLVCFWSGSPNHVTLVSGTLFNKVLASYDSSPAPVPSAGVPVITTATLPPAVVGQPYSARLTTADNRNGSWSIASGNLPVGLSLIGDTISGKPTTQQTTSFAVGFLDTDSNFASRSESISVTITGSNSSGAIENLDYCHQNTISANDDNSTGAIALPFAADFYGQSYTAAYVSNNGYIVFDAPRSTFTPFDMVDEFPTPIIAPFFGDVDTRDPGSALVTYGSSPDGRSFCVNWVGVGYYNTHADKLNSFQLLLTSRPDVASGDFDITFNYGDINWETGDASGGTGGIGGVAARAGYSAGTSAPGTSFELSGSGTTGALLDGGANALNASSVGANGQRGRDVFAIRN